MGGLWSFWAWWPASCLQPQHRHQAHLCKRIPLHKHCLSLLLRWRSASWCMTSKQRHSYSTLVPHCCPTLSDIINSVIPMMGELTSVKISDDSRFALINHAPDVSLSKCSPSRKFTLDRKYNSGSWRLCAWCANLVVTNSQDTSFVAVLVALMATLSCLGAKVIRCHCRLVDFL